MLKYEEFTSYSLTPGRGTKDRAQNCKDANMLTLKKPMNQYYNEVEAAHSLCISLPALHELLDEHVFNLDHPRPAVLDFSHAELLLLSVWAVPERGRNVVAMPCRN